MTAPAIDVVIPVFNGARTIREAVGSIQAQTAGRLRIIVVDDGSTDGTEGILQSMAAEDSRLHVLRQANSGIVDALNAGFAAGQAPLVARHDADDWAAPTRFETQLAYLQAHPGCAAVSGAVRHMDEAGREHGPVVRLPSPDVADPDAFPQREPYLMHPFLMARRSAIEAAGGYRHVFHAEDTDLYWRLQERGGLHNLPDVLGRYRVHAGSITGASLLNGRIAAVNAQLAGLSARRRRAGRADLVFAKATLGEYKAARSLEGVIRVASRALDPDEAARLAPAACAKLLEVASYRPYELDAEDCTFIRRTLADAMPGMDPASRSNCARMLSGTAARLAAEGKLRLAAALAPARLYPAVAARWALRAALPAPVRGALRQMAGRAATK